MKFRAGSKKRTTRESAKRLHKIRHGSERQQSVMRRDTHRAAVAAALHLAWNSKREQDSRS